MSNSEKILKTLSHLVENSILTSKYIREEMITDLKFKKDKIINRLNLVTREGILKYNFKNESGFWCVIKILQLYILLVNL